AGRTASSDLRGGEQAGRSMVDLMIESLAVLPPEKIIEAYNEGKGHDQLHHMFDTLGDHTAERLAAGALALARLWSSAWEEGGGANIQDGALVVIDTGVLQANYRDKKFAPSFELQDPSFAQALTG